MKTTIMIEPTAPFRLDVFHDESRKVLVARTPEFERKQLATHAVEVGFKCDVGCMYCSTPSVYRTQAVFGRIGRTAFQDGFAVIDPDTPNRLGEELHKLGTGDVVMLSTKTDAWSPEARKHAIGTRCLRAILEQTPAKVRILTKNAKVAEDFDLIHRYRDRVMVGISVTGLPEHEAILRVLEPAASPVSERIDAMHQASARGLRTYAMFCPMFLGLLGGGWKNTSSLVKLATLWHVEDIWTEILNPRGNALIRCIEALRTAGYGKIADRFDTMRHLTSRSAYGVKLTLKVQSVCEKLGLLDRLHILHYKSSFTPEAVSAINRNPAGVIWL